MWNDLSMVQKRDLMDIFIRNGITSLEEMRRTYNTFADGGDTDGGKFNFTYKTKTQRDTEDAAIENPEQYLNKADYLKSSFGYNDDVYKKQFGKKWYKEQYVPLMDKYYSGNATQKETAYGLAGLMNTRNYSSHPVLNDYWNNDSRVERDYMDAAMNAALQNQDIQSRINEEYSSAVDPLRSSANYINDYYNSEAYRNRANKYGVPSENPLKKEYNIEVKDAPEEIDTILATSGMYGSRAIGNNIRIMHDWDVEKKIAPEQAVLAHELGHENPLFNTRINWDSYKYPEDKNRLSPYYWFDYTNIPDEWVEYLKPTNNIQDLDEHDVELNENYSDLVGLREALYRNGIFDSSDGSIFTQDMLDRFRQTGEANRFLKYHTDEQIINALNEVAQNSQHSQDVNYAANGGPIHINPSNNGKFTESANRAGMGVQEFARHVLANKDDYSTTQIRRANFARNAKKWHADGGVLGKGFRVDKGEANRGRQLLEEGIKARNTGINARGEKIGENQNIAAIVAYNEAMALGLNEDETNQYIYDYCTNKWGSAKQQQEALKSYRDPVLNLSIEDRRLYQSYAQQLQAVDSYIRTHGGKDPRPANSNYTIGNLPSTNTENAMRRWLDERGLNPYTNSDVQNSRDTAKRIIELQEQRDDIQRDSFKPYMNPAINDLIIDLAGTAMGVGALSKEAKAADMLSRNRYLVGANADAYNKLMHDANALHAAGLGLDVFAVGKDAIQAATDNNPGIASSAFDVLGLGASAMDYWRVFPKLNGAFGILGGAAGIVGDVYNIIQNSKEHRADVAKEHNRLRQINEEIDKLKNQDNVY